MHLNCSYVRVNVKVIAGQHTLRERLAGKWLRFPLLQMILQCFLRVSFLKCTCVSFRRLSGRTQGCMAQQRTGRRRCPAPISASWWSSLTAGLSTGWHKGWWPQSLCKHTTLKYSLHYIDISACFMSSRVCPGSAMLRDSYVHQSTLFDQVIEAASRSLPRVRMAIMSLHSFPHTGRQRLALPALCSCTHSNTF